MIREPLTVRLELDSHPENVALVRSAATGIAEALELGEPLTSDFKTALSEACNNVSLHAYEGASGPMHVQVDATAVGIAVTVIDHGSGILRLSGGEDRMGLGLAVISALASSCEFRHPEGGGTEVRIYFRRRSNDGLEEDLHARRGTDELPGFEPRANGEIHTYITPVDATRYVLGRMVPALAAAAHFSIAKLGDLRAANEALSSYLERAGDGGVSIGITTGSRRLAMTAQPLPRNDPESARAELSPVVDDLLAADGELVVVLSDSSR